MAETLGSLCDKLTIVRLKQWHTTDRERKKSLARQLAVLEQEVEAFVCQAASGQIPMSQLKFEANKVYREKTHACQEINGNLGGVISKLAEVNCALWHQQEKIYEFERVPARSKNGTIRRLAILNLERNKCIEKINEIFREDIRASSEKSRGKSLSRPT